MSEAVEKFISSLEIQNNFWKEIIEKNTKNYKKVQIGEIIYSFSKIVSEQGDLERFLGFMKSPIENDPRNEVYKYFNYFTSAMELVKLTAKEKKDIVFYVIEKNWKRFSFGPIEDNAILDLNALCESYVPSMTPNQFENWIQKFNIIEILKTKEENLNEEERLLKTKIAEVLMQGQEEHKLLIRVHKYIVDHYLSKKDTYTEKDLQFIKVGLKYLGVTSSVRTSIMSVLKRELEKRNKEKTMSKNNQKNTSVSLSTKEKEMIFKEIMCMYNLQEHKVVKPLKKDEIVYLVSLMMQIHIPEVEIRKCIQEINWHGIQAYTNPIEEFNDYVEKITRNSTYGDVEIALENIKEYLNILFLLKQDQEYIGWKNEIAEELKRIRNILNQDDFFELEMARVRLKKREGKRNE